MTKPKTKEMEIDEIFKNCFEQIQNVVSIKKSEYKKIDTAISICYRRIQFLLQNQPEVVVTYHSGEKVGHKIQPEITMKEIQGWAEEARERVVNHESWEYLEGVMKEMLEEVGIKVKDGKQIY